MLTNTDGNLSRSAPTFQGSLMRSGNGQADLPEVGMAIYYSTTSILYYSLACELRRRIKSAFHDPICMLYTDNSVVN